MYYTQLACNQELGLSTTYRDSPDAQRLIRKLMALAFLPVISVRPAFLELKDDPLVTELNLTSLFTYYHETWLQLFKPHFWNVHNQTTQTNNHLEGWHSKLNRAIGKIHPGIHELIKVLKVEQSTTDATVQRARLGAAPPPRRKKYRQLDERLDRLTQNFRAGEYTVNDFLDCMRHIVHHY